ncbi:hypothetical protein EON82_02175 [bacterium]|nr:MAG: hypothetical protein EON82_02175 [bacterium]
MERSQRRFLNRFLVILFCFFSIGSAFATPQFAREANLPCAACHIHGSLLNSFGNRYFANGFRVGKKRPLRNTPPLWGTLGFALRSNRSLGSAILVDYGQTEIASYGYIDDLELLYHLAYQPSKEQTDIYLLQKLGNKATVQAGEIGLLGQYNAKHDVSPTRPVTLMPTGFGDKGPFAPGANAFAVRVVGSLTGPSAMPYADGWKVAATVPFSNEETQAWQPEFDGSPRGIFTEVFNRIGMASYGANLFLGRDERRYYGLLGQHQVGKVYFEGGVAYAESRASPQGLASISGTYVPEYHQAYAFRIDYQNGQLSYVPTFGLMIGDQKSVLRLTAEVRVTRGAAPKTTFSAQLKF